MRRTRDITFNSSEDKLTVGEYKISYSADTPRNALSMGHVTLSRKKFFFPSDNESSRTLYPLYISGPSPVIISLNAFR